MFYLTTHSTHFMYGYMASDIWLRTILIMRKETCCCHIGYSYQQWFFYMHHPKDRITHTTAFVTPIVPWVNTLPLSYVPLPWRLEPKNAPNLPWLPVHIFSPNLSVRDLVCLQRSRTCRIPEYHFQHCWSCPTPFRACVGRVSAAPRLCHCPVRRESTLPATYSYPHPHSPQQQLWENEK